MGEGEAKPFLLLFLLKEWLLAGFAAVVPFEGKGFLQGSLTSLNPANIGDGGEGHLAVAGVPCCGSNKSSPSGRVDRERPAFSLLGGCWGMACVPDRAITKILVVSNSLIGPARAKAQCLDRTSLLI